MSDTVGQREYIFSYKSDSLYFGLEMRMLKATFRTSRSDLSFLTNHNYSFGNLTGSADREIVFLGIIRNSNKLLEPERLIRVCLNH